MHDFAALNSEVVILDVDVIFGEIIRERLDDTGAVLACQGQDVALGFSFGIFRSLMKISHGDRDFIRREILTYSVVDFGFIERLLEGGRDDHGEVSVDDRLAHAVDIAAPIRNRARDAFDNPDPVQRQDRNNVPILPFAQFRSPVQGV